MEQQNAFKNNLQNMLSGFFQNQSLTSGTLLSNTIANLKGEMKAITTRSGVTYEGPSIHTPKKVVEQETEETTDKEKTNFLGSTAHIQPPVTLILEPMDVSNDVIKLMMFPYSLEGTARVWENASRTDDRLYKLADQISTLVEIVSKKVVTHATVKAVEESCVTCSGVAEDVFVKVGKFHFPTNFLVVDFEADPRVPLILGRSFLRISRALIDVYGEEITLRVNDEAVTFNLNQTMRYSSTYDDMSGNDFILEEIETYLKDESISPEIDHVDYDPEGDIFLIEKLLNSDPFQLPPIDLKQREVAKEKSLIEEPSELELKDLPSYLEYAYL
nr:DNA-directed DNA polymerase [Tanacetum cinerariifolium]